MRIVAINSVNYGSTGGIMLGIAECAREHGIEYYTFSSAGLNARKDITGNRKIGTIPEKVLSGELNAYIGSNGKFNYFGTMQLIRDIKKIDPDIIHLHNLHSNYLNLAMLFDYIKTERKKVVWTLHDCWAFTGKCPCFELADCERWKTGCYECSQLSEYPKFRIDNTEKAWKWKKELFTGVENLTIVTPSDWLAYLVKQSFLNIYPVRVINNGINLSIFKPTPGNFREEHGIKPNQTMLLGVANVWDRRKGLNFFLELNQYLDERYKIVLVGTNNEIDRTLPRNIVSVHHTKDRQELAEIYSVADVFINPTLEDNYPTVNLEAIACGTPVITFNTGGSPETIRVSSNSVVTESKDMAGLLKAIKDFSLDSIKQPEIEDCRDSLNEEEKYLEYIDIYENSTCCTICTV